MATQAQPLPAITVQEIASGEFLEWQRVYDASFGKGTGGFMDLLWPDPKIVDGEHSAKSAEIQEGIWKNDPSARYMTAKIPSGKIVGIAKWNFFLNADPQFPWQSDQPPGAQVEKINWFFGRLDKVRNETMKGKKHALMAVLAIDPEYQRMGVGGKLLDWGLAKCDAEGIDCWIDASEAGKGLYEKFGWKEVECVNVDLGEWGGEKGSIMTTSNMLRLAQPVQGSS